MKSVSVPSCTGVTVSLVAVVVVFLVLYSAFCGKILFENLTVSGPRGLYLRSFSQQLAPDDWVVIRPGKSQLQKLLLKQVRAFPGDAFEVSPAALTVGSRLFPIYPDAKLVHVPAGRYIVPHGSYLFLNDSPESYDSRYFGPVPAGEILCKVWLILSYEPFFSFKELF